MIRPEDIKNLGVLTTLQEEYNQACIKASFKIIAALND